MTSAEERTVEQWRLAARDLVFTFVSPFTLDHAGETLEYLGWLPQFGSDRGMLIITSPFEAQGRLIRAADSRGYGYSCMSASGEPYDRDVMIEVLTDWGWASSEPAPPWYIVPTDDTEEA
jgi:hypothetical protein